MPVEKQCSAINPNNCRTDLKGQEKSTGHFVKTASGMLSHRKGKGVHTAESLYKFLIEDWVPPSLEFDQTNCDDEDWLFRTKKQVHASKSLRSQRDGPCLESSALWPSALYLPQVDVYALPYTVPFQCQLLGILKKIFRLFMVPRVFFPSSFRVSNGPFTGRWQKSICNLGMRMQNHVQQKKFTV